MPHPGRPCLPLLLGEDLQTATHEDVDFWVDVYRELTRFSLRSPDKRLGRRYGERLAYWVGRQRDVQDGGEPQIRRRQPVGGACGGLDTVLSAAGHPIASLR